MTDDHAPAAVLRQRGAVVRAEWDDPDDTNDRTRKPWQVTGWTRADPVADIFPPGSCEREAATRLRDDVALADGLKPQTPLGARVSGTGPMTPTETQLDAIGRVRAACRALTPAEIDVASWAVVNGASLASYERYAGIRSKGKAGTILRGCLRALAGHYGIAPRN